MSLGLRTDAIDFNEEMRNMLNQLSPRVALSYRFTDAFSFNASWGIYYQLPPYTTLGFRNEMGDLVNTNMKYIRSEHWVAGFEYLFTFNGRASIEGFCIISSHVLRAVSGERRALAITSARSGPATMGAR